jgi:hypothetical protein
VFLIQLLIPWQCKGTSQIPWMNCALLPQQHGWRWKLLRASSGSSTHDQNLLFVSSYIRTAILELRCQTSNSSNEWYIRLKT